MFGEPEDVKGDCNARLHIGDDFGDNHATMRCDLEPGHGGMHCEEYTANGGHVSVKWEIPELNPETK